MNSRDKGKRGESELAKLLSELTGFDVRRRVRQYAGDSDLEGLPAWSVECKRHGNPSPAFVWGVFWPQAVAQAQASNALPLLAYRADRGLWTFVWPSDLHTGVQPIRTDYPHVLLAPPETWWAMTRHLTTH